MKAIIIAGGLGTRLRPLTYNRAKPVVPLVNKPFVVHQIELLKKYGITDIILNLHYLPKNLELLLGNGKDLGVKLSYSIEDKPLGTAGAVKNAEEYFDGEPLLVFNGDILTDIDLSKLIKYHKDKKAAATLSLTRVEDPTPYGLVLLAEDGRVEKFLEKPNWEMVSDNTINAGIYVLDPKIFASVPKAVPFSFERELFPGLLNSGSPVYGYIFEGYWMDIGSPKKYMQAHRDILSGDVTVNINGKKTDNTWIGEGTVMGDGAKVSGPAVIGEKVAVGENARVKSFSVVGDSVKIGHGALVEDSIIMRNSSIGRDVKLKNCIVGENCIIEDYVEMIYGVVLADYSIVKKGSRLI